MYDKIHHTEIEPSIDHLTIMKKSKLKWCGTSCEHFVLANNSSRESGR